MSLSIYRAYEYDFIFSAMTSRNPQVQVFNTGARATAKAREPRKNYCRLAQS
jgi:hypothetical protein